MRIAVLALSDRGLALAHRLAEGSHHHIECDRCKRGGLADWTAGHFGSYDALVFVGAVGIAVRAIAPHVVSKLQDPAVVVIDELGRSAVSVLSGHVGRANELTEELATILGARAIITTATDISHVFAFDSWAVRQGLSIDDAHAVKTVSSKLLTGETVSVKSEVPVDGPLPGGVRWWDEGMAHGPDVLIGYHVPSDEECLHLVARDVFVGIGCRRGTPADAVERAFSQGVVQAGYHPTCIAAVASIDLKAHEPGLVGFCDAHGYRFMTYPAAELDHLEGSFSGSEFVYRTTGVDNVCERAACLASDGRLLEGKRSYGGVTVALALHERRYSFPEGT